MSYNILFMERKGQRRLGAAVAGTAALLTACGADIPTEWSENSCSHPAVSCRLEYIALPEKPLDLKSLAVETNGVEIDFTKVCGELGFRDYVSAEYCEERLGPSRNCADEEHLGHACSYQGWGIKVAVNDDGTLNLAGTETSVVDLSRAINEAVVNPGKNAEIKPIDSEKLSFGQEVLLVVGLSGTIFIGLSALAFIGMIRQTRNAGLTEEQIKGRKNEKKARKEKLRETKKEIDRKGGAVITARDSSGTVFEGYATNPRKAVGIHGLSEVPAAVESRRVSPGLYKIKVNFGRFDMVPTPDIPVEGRLIPRRISLLKDTAEGYKHRYVEYEDL